MSSVGENWNVLKNLINIRLRVYMQVSDAIFCLNWDYYLNVKHYNLMTYSRRNFILLYYLYNYIKWMWNQFFLNLVSKIFIRFLLDIHIFKVTFYLLKLYSIFLL